MPRKTYPSKRYANINGMNYAAEGKEWREGKKPYGPRQSKDKRELLARGLQNLGMPDVTVWEEIFHASVLEDVYREAGYKQFFVYMPHETGDQPCTAIVSTEELEKFELLTEIPKEVRDPGDDNELYHNYRRAMVHGVVKVADDLYNDVYGGHFKSKLPLFLPRRRRQRSQGIPPRYEADDDPAC